MMPQVREDYQDMYQTTESILNEILQAISIFQEDTNKSINELSIISQRYNLEQPHLDVLSDSKIFDYISEGLYQIPDKLPDFPIETALSLISRLLKKGNFLEKMFYNAHFLEICISLLSFKDKKITERVCEMLLAFNRFDGGLQMIIQSEITENLVEFLSIDNFTIKRDSLFLIKDITPFIEDDEALQQIAAQIFKLVFKGQDCIRISAIMTLKTLCKQSASVCAYLVQYPSCIFSRSNTILNVAPENGRFTDHMIQMLTVITRQIPDAITNEVIDSMPLTDLIQEFLVPNSQIDKETRETQSFFMEFLQALLDLNSPHVMDLMFSVPLIEILSDSLDIAPMIYKESIISFMHSVILLNHELVIPILLRNSNFEVLFADISCLKDETIIKVLKTIDYLVNLNNDYKVMLVDINLEVELNNIIENKDSNIVEYAETILQLLAN